jgi:hypothetical protein
VTSREKVSKVVVVFIILFSAVISACAHPLLIERTFSTDDSQMINCHISLLVGKKTEGERKKRHNQGGFAMQASLSLLW